MQGAYARLDLARDETDQRGLAGTIGAEECRHPRADRQVDSTQAQHVSVPTGYGLELDGVHEVTSVD
jgi:hypothetical protein